jgi:histidyl-tRNA synthetase
MSRNLLPSKGMRDFMPEEKRLRERVMGIIRDEYARNGFLEIETPVVEDIERLIDSDGGENTKMIFKILKRGEKLDLGASNLKEDELIDLGLRFDLTLPLSRFYCNNHNDLPKVFKAMQTGFVFRAERPQRGRFRSFMQCDVDIMGDDTNFSEIELIDVVGKTLNRLGVEGFKVKINDRRLLTDAILKSGLDKEDVTRACISLDKADKIGIDGVRKDLEKQGFQSESVEKLMTIMENISADGLDGAEKSGLNPEAVNSLREIMSAVLSMNDGRYGIEFDFTLVRGMGYYTGTIFEVAYGDLGYSIAGGGRYDNMIGNFMGKQVPAVGFSIGFERLVEILKERGEDQMEEDHVALIFESEAPGEVIKAGDSIRDQYKSVSAFRREKKFGRQLERLKKAGYRHFAVIEDGKPVVKEI